MKTDGEGVGIEDADEIASAVQGRNISQTKRERTARGIDQRGFVEVARRWGRFAPEIQIKRQAGVDLRQRDGEIAGVGRHIHEEVGPLIGEHCRIHSVGHQQLRLDPQRQALHPPRFPARVVAHRQKPDTRTALTHKAVEAPRPVRPPAQEILPAPAVVIDQREKRVARVVVAIVVVQHRELILVTEIAQQVAYGLVPQIVAHDHARDWLRLDAHRKH